MEEITGAEASISNQIGDDPAAVAREVTGTNLSPLPSQIIPESHVPIPGVRIFYYG